MIAKFLKKIGAGIVVAGLFFFISCSDEQNDKVAPPPPGSNFTKLWQSDRYGNYPYREMLYANVMKDDSIRALSQKQLLNMLGTPDRSEDNYMYYIIKRKKIGFLTLHTQTLVIKYKDSLHLDWMKIHE